MFEPPSAEAPYVELATAESLCGTRNVQMSPDGGRLTLAYENSFGPLSLNLGYVIVADTDCLFQKAACNLWKIGAVSSVRYPQWSSVDRSLFVVGGDARSRPAWAIKYSTKEGANGLELTLAENEGRVRSDLVLRVIDLGNHLILPIEDVLGSA